MRPDAAPNVIGKERGFMGRTRPETGKQNPKF
jgi:hypothetical protein